MTSLSTDLQNLLTRRSNIFAQLAALTSTSIGGGPNTTGEGVSVDQQGYRLSLMKELESINKMISLVGGPYEMSTRARLG